MQFDFVPTEDRACPTCEGGRLEWNYVQEEWMHWSSIRVLSEVCPNFPKPTYTSLGDEVFGSTRIRSRFWPKAEKLEMLTYQERYADYLQSSSWRELRRRILIRDGYRCMFCNASRQLDVHHRSYERVFDEDESDLVTLCRRCHSRHHGKGGE